jgi:putative ABC transport system ATP-binding protein
MALRSLAPPAALESHRQPVTDHPQLECRALTKTLPSGARELTILAHVDLQIAKGELVAVLGPSGSGKSTLLGLLAGLDRPTSGSVLIEGRPIEGLDEDQLALLRRSRVGFVFQSFQLLGNLTARENVLMPLELTGFEGAAERADEVLREVGLADRGHHYPSQLSGGEQQRVAVARAFASRPTLLLADEPTGNLDSETGERVLQLLLDMRERHGTTLVLVTHDQAVASRADRQLRMLDGRLERDSNDSAANTSVSPLHSTE